MIKLAAEDDWIRHRTYDVQHVYSNCLHRAFYMKNSLSLSLSAQLLEIFLRLFFFFLIHCTSVMMDVFLLQFMTSTFALTSPFFLVGQSSKAPDHTPLGQFRFWSTSLLFPIHTWCTHACPHTHTHTHIYMCVHKYACMHVCVHTQMLAFLHACTQTCMHAYTYVQREREKLGGGEGGEKRWVFRADLNKEQILIFVLFCF